MKGRYPTWRRYALTKVKRTALQIVLRRLLRWGPISNPKPGYTILIGCNAPLAEMLATNLSFLERQDLTHLDQVIVVFDRPKNQIPVPIEDKMRQRFSGLPMHFIYYTDKQAKLLQRLGWAWIYSWFSWCLGIQATHTRYAFLHDFDAMPIRADLLEERWREIERTGAQYLAVLPYQGNGLVVADGFAATFEMMFDAAFVRRRFQPLDLFSHVGKFEGRGVDYDTFLWAQSQAGKRLVLEVDMQGLVHPSQMICQYTEFMRQLNYVPPEMNNLLMIPYFLYLAGDAGWMAELLPQLRDVCLKHPTIDYRGKQMNVHKLTRVHAHWLTEQMKRLEHATAGTVRPEVNDYFTAIREMQERLETAAPPNPAPVALRGR